VSLNRQVNVAGEQCSGVFSPIAWLLDVEWGVYKSIAATFVTNVGLSLLLGAAARHNSAAHHEIGGDSYYLSDSMKNFFSWYKLSELAVTGVSVAVVSSQSCYIGPVLASVITFFGRLTGNKIAQEIGLDGLVVAVGALAASIVDSSEGLDLELGGTVATAVVGESTIE
jgi:hypothetical protein